jgi:hypothetical protein
MTSRIAYFLRWREVYVAQRSLTSHRRRRRCIRLQGSFIELARPTVTLPRASKCLYNRANPQQKEVHMIEKKNSAVQRVFKSVVGPTIGASMVLLMSCSTTTPSNNVPTTDKPVPVIQPKPPIPDPVPANTSGGVVDPVPVVGLPMPGSIPTISVPPPVVGITPLKPEIPEPGKIEKVGEIPARVGKIAVGKIAPHDKTIRKVGVKALPDKPINKVGTIPNPDIRSPGKVPEKVGKIAPPDLDIDKVGTHMEVQPEGSLQAPQERPTRFTRRTTDESSGVLRTGFVGGRKLT